MRPKHLLWKDVYKDFKIHRPRIAHNVIGWQPYSFGQIKLWHKDGKTIYIYDYDKHDIVDKFDRPLD